LVIAGGLDGLVAQPTDPDPSLLAVAFSPPGLFGV
jgi:hypothetical protein